MSIRRLLYAASAAAILGVAVAAWIMGPAPGKPSDNQGAINAAKPSASPPVASVAARGAPTPAANAFAIEPETGPQPTTLPEQAPGEGGDHLERINVLLTDGHHTAAVDLFGELHSQLSDADIRRYRAAILSHAHALTAADRHRSASDLLASYTHLFFKDLEALHLLADSLHLQQRYADEIDTIMLALNEAYLEIDLAEFNRKLDGAIAAQDLLYIQRTDPTGAIEFRRSLALARPESIPYQLGLARALLNAGLLDEVRAVLDALPKYTEFDGQIDRLRQMVEASGPAAADESAVPLSRLGNGFVVEAVLNNGQNVRLLVDTGATLTIIRPGALSRAGVGQEAFVRETTLETAGGRVGATVYRLDSLRLGPEVVADIIVGSVEIPGLGAIDGLLGMDVLGRFKFSIDQTRQRMLLAR